jgi:hypothetical protein
MTFTKTDLTPAFLQLFDNVRKELPAEIAERLTCSRVVRNHGSYRTVLLFNVWDKNQSDVLPKQHFCYCLGYDPKQLISGGTDWYFHLWLNTIRIYRNRLALKKELETKLSKKCPPKFQFEVMDRAVQAKMNFNFSGDVNRLIAFLKPHYVQLIKAMHPVLMPVIDQFSIYGTREEIKAEIASRGRIAHKPVRTARPDLVREYSRSIPPSWRVELLEKFGYKCVHCGCSLKGIKHHMDHIRPFSRGGTRKKNNFQPLCVECNLRKGNRYFY